MITFPVTEINVLLQRDSLNLCFNLHARYDDLTEDMMEDIHEKMTAIEGDGDNDHA